MKKYNVIWEKVKNNVKKEFDSEPVYSEKYLKAKIKSYNGKIKTNFHDNKIPKEGSQLICLSVILTDSVFRTGKSYYPKVFLEEYKHVVKEKKIPKYAIDDIEVSSDSDFFWWRKFWWRKFWSRKFWWIKFLFCIYENDK